MTFHNATMINMANLRCNFGPGAPSYPVPPVGYMWNFTNFPPASWPVTVVNTLQKSNGVPSYELVVDFKFAVSNWSALFNYYYPLQVIAYDQNGTQIASKNSQCSNNVGWWNAFGAPPTQCAPNEQIALNVQGIRSIRVQLLCRGGGTACVPPNTYEWINAKFSLDNMVFTFVVTG